MKLIHPVKFKMHKVTIDQDHDYWFGSLGFLRDRESDSLVERNPNENDYRKEGLGFNFSELYLLMRESLNK